MDTLSSGRVVVHNPDSPADDLAWILEETFRIGSLEEVGPELFGSIGGLALGPAGEVYVLDDQASEVRVFDREGAFVRTLGREGEGPGELMNPSGLTLDSDGTLWVMNWGNARYTGFDPETGEVRREVRRPMSFASFPWTGAFVDGGRRLLDIGLGADRQPAILQLDTAFLSRDTLPLPARDPDASIAFRSGSTMVATLMEPFAPQAVWAPRPQGGIVLGEGGSYRLHRIGFDRDTSMTIELARDDVRVSEFERASAIAFFEEMAGTLDGATAERRPRARDTHPSHGPIFVDDEDQAWVRGTAPRGTPPRWDVFGSDGRFLARVQIPHPPGFIRPVVRNGRAAVATQVDGFPVVVVYELVKRSGS